MKDISDSKQFTRNIILITTIFSVSYAVLRYNIYGDVPWKDLPLYVLNKGISLSSLILLTFNFSLSPLKNIGVKVSDKWLRARKTMGMVGFLYAFAHVFMSVSILNPNYYAVFFIEDGTLSIRGNLSLLGGVLSFVLLWVYYISFKLTLKEDKRIIAVITSKRFFIYLLFFLGIHLFFMGYTGWTTIYKWQGGLPPISLISFIVFFLGFLINFFRKK